MMVEVNITLTGVSIAQDTKNLAFELDNLTSSIIVTVDTDSDFNYQLYVEYPKNCGCAGQLYNIINMNRVGNVCSVDVTADMLPFNGKYTMQLVGTSGQKRYHSDTFDAWVKRSIDPDKAYEPMPSAFTQTLDAITELNQHPPKPDPSGYWAIWNLTTKQYELSDIPTGVTLPDISEATAGMYLSNDGSSTKWQSVSEVPEMSEATKDKILSNDGESAQWIDPSENGVTSINGQKGDLTLKTINNEGLLGEGNIELTKEDVGLGEVDNVKQYSEINKPTASDVVFGDSNVDDALNGKMDKVNPTGTGYMTIGQRSEDSGKGNSSLAVGDNVEASGNLSVAVGDNCVASGLASIAFGARLASTERKTTASGVASFANGGSVVASGGYAHASGEFTTASGTASNAEGYRTEATAFTAQAKGVNTKANGRASTAEGIVTVAKAAAQVVTGAANVEDTTEVEGHLPYKIGKYLHIVGNGDVSVDSNGIFNAERQSNAYALDWDGNGHFGGDVYVGCEDDSSGGKKVATEAAVSAKADKVNGAVNGHFAALDSTGNLTDSGYNADSFVTSVNGKTGEVTIDYADVGADESGAAQGVQDNLDNHINDKANPHNVTKDQVGLSNVDNTSDMNKPVSTAQGVAIAAVQSAVDNEVTARENADTALSQRIDNVDSRVTVVEGKIPTQASAANQLADKEYVNDAINQSAAYFKGNYDTYAELIAVAWQTADPNADYYVTNNDYAVVDADETHEGTTWRYIYVLGEGWTAQYKIHDTPLTPAQQSAINSGITSTLVTQIGTNQEDIATHIEDMSNPHEVTKAQVGLGNVANERQYSAQNPPPYPVTSVAGKTGAVSLTKSDVGLSNVDNTSDVNKPISTATKTYIDNNFNPDVGYRVVNGVVCASWEE